MSRTGIILKRAPRGFADGFDVEQKEKIKSRLTLGELARASE